MRGMGSSLRYSFRAPVIAWMSSIEVKSEHMSAEKREWECQAKGSSNFIRIETELESDCTDKGCRTAPQGI